MISIIRRFLNESAKKAAYKKELRQRQKSRDALYEKLREYAKPSVCRTEFSFHKIHKMQQAAKQLNEEIEFLKERIK